MLLIEDNLTMYITIVTTSGVLSAFLSIYAYSKRKNIPGARDLILMTALQSLYIFAFAFELASDSLEEIKRWIAIGYVGIAFAPVLSVRLLANYVGRTLSRLSSYALFIIPAITVLLVATNDWHGIFYKMIYLRPHSPTPMVDVEIGKWYIVHGAYTFSCLLAGAVLLLMQWNKTKRHYRIQLSVLICGQLIPMIAAFVYLMGLTPNGMDPVPFVLFVTSALYLWAILSAGMFTIMPIAKERIFESMREGVLVLNWEERLIEYNGAMKKTLPALLPAMIGKPLDDVWRSLMGESFPIPRSSDSDGVMGIINWRVDDKLSYYEVRSSSVKGKNKDRIGNLLIFIDVTEQVRLQEQLTEMAYFDGLTGICNRMQFIRSSRELLEYANRHGQKLSIILFDIDRFKRFNDTYGHEIGDQVILHLVKICKSHLEPNMLLARYGGEEFVLVLPETGQDSAVAMANRMRESLQNEPLACEAGILLVTASFGVAELTPFSDSIEALLRNADAALYEAKRTGRNRVCSHS